MEDLFQILIIIFFIVSSIASSMKKKKKQQSKKTTSFPQQSEKPNTIAKKQKSSAEVLEEMFGFKLELPEPQKTEAPYKYSEENYSDTWNPESDFEEFSTEGKSDYAEKITEKKNELTNDKQKHRAFKDENLQISKNSQIEPQSKFSKLFAQQSNLKDYIIIQEILNKPKALRR